MKISKKQHDEIINIAMNEIRSGNLNFLCIALALAINTVLNENYDSQIRAIKRYIPEFKQSVAIKYFHAHRTYTWWGSTEKDRKTRIRFLRYLKNGKLPKEVNVK